MKTCGYCGRENEDDAVFCRECGLNEFPAPSVATVPVQQQPAAPTGEDVECPTPDISPDEEAAICPFCLFPNVPDRQWCKRCGAPINAAVFGPFESAVNCGCMWRGAVRGRPKLWVLLTLWCLFFPAFCVGASIFLGGLFSGNFFILSTGVLATVIPLSILFQATRNYVTIPKTTLD
jgi:hypothetical protein